MYGAPTPKDPNVDIPRSRVGVFDKVLKTISTQVPEQVKPTKYINLFCCFCLAHCFKLRGIVNSFSFVKDE